MKKPNYFQLFIDNRAQFELLSDAQAGALMKALFSYAGDGMEPDFSGDQALQIMFSFLSANIDREFGNYSTMCERNRKNSNMRNTGRCVSDEKLSTRIDSTEEEEKEEKEEEKEKDKDKDKDEEKENAADAACERVVESFHSLCPALPRVSRLTRKRRQAIKKALRDRSTQELCDAFEKVSQSSFLCGEGGGWQADFDWILKPDNLLRIIEGSYAGREPAPPIERNYDIDALDEINRMEDYDFDCDGSG